MTGYDPSDEIIARDTEESLVAALQESDSAVDAVHDANADAGRKERRRRMITVGGMLLAALGLVVARRRG